jgi:toxin FitB
MVRSRRAAPALPAMGRLRRAELVAALRSSGRAMPIKDSLIIATALVHGLTGATRNRTDFEKVGVEVVDPFADE